MNIYIYWILDLFYNISLTNISNLNIDYIYQYNIIKLQTFKYNIIFKKVLNKTFLHFNNMLDISKKKFEISILYKGIGFFIQKYKKNILKIHIDSTHDLYIQLPEEITYILDDNNKILKLLHYNKELITMIGHRIIKLKEGIKNPYKDLGFYLI